MTEHLAPILPLCDLIVGTEEELHIAGRSRRTPSRRSARIRAQSAATIVCKRGPMGCVVFPDAIPSSLEDGVKGPGYPVEVLQRARRRRRLPRRASCAAGCAASRSRPPAPTPMPAAPSPCRACSARRRSRPSRSCSIFLRNGSLAPGPAPRPGAQPPSLGDDPPPGAGHADGARDRPPRRSSRRWRRRRVHRRADRPLQDARRRGRGPRRQGSSRTSACSSTTPIGREALFRAGRAPVLDRPPGRGAGLAAARVRGGGDLGTKLVEWPAAARRQVPVLLSSGRSARPEGAAGSASSCASTTPPARSAASCCRDHLRQAWPDGDRHRRCGDRPPLRDRHQAGLVEARAAGRCGRVACRGGGDRPARPALPRHRAAGPRGAGARARCRLRDCRAGAPGQGLRDRPDDLRRGRQPLAQGRDHDEAAVADMADRFARLVESLASGRRLARAA